MTTGEATRHDLSYWQGARYRQGQSRGHYESWFLRANHPTRNVAFWIRYTIFAPHGRPQDAIGELWAIYFDGELRGSASGAHGIRWRLTYRDGGAPMIFLPERTYEARLPKAKALCTRPRVVFDGALDVDGESIAIDGWIGSENHNWGSRHTDTYAWGQVVGFDDAPEAFLECVTAKLKLGPLWTPPMTIVCLRFGGHDYRLNSRLQPIRAKGAWKDFDWRFDSTEAGVRIHGRIHAAPEDFVSLKYCNPPGGTHTCLNSKLAACEVTLERSGEPAVALTTRHRAAFEILT